MKAALAFGLCGTTLPKKLARTTPFVNFLGLRESISEWGLKAQAASVTELFVAS
jgi:hypothetical protein